MMFIICFVVPLLIMIIGCSVILIRLRIDNKKYMQEQLQRSRLIWNSMSTEQKLAEISLSQISLPKYCPSCNALNYEAHENGRAATPKWILDSSQTIEQERFDHATTFMGSTTIHTQKHQKEVKTYRCPKCGYKISK